MDEETRQKQAFIHALGYKRDAETPKRKGFDSVTNRLIHEYKSPHDSPNMFSVDRKNIYHIISRHPEANEEALTNPHEGVTSNIHVTQLEPEESYQPTNKHN